MTAAEGTGGLPAGVQRGAGVLVVVPTYQEALNVEEVVARLRGAVPLAHLLVVDDSSPDGTGALADALAAADPQVHVLHRRAKEGLGQAYLAGFGWGLERDYDVLVEMDADGSHQPEQLPALLAVLPEADLVLGSRWVPGGSVVNWPIRRRLLSQGGNAYVRRALGIGVAGRDRRLPRLPAYDAGEARPGRRSPARATASRSTSRGAPCSRGSASSRCRSSSSSGSAGRRR